MARVFRDHLQDQTLLFTLSLNEMIGANQPVPLVNNRIDSLDLDPLGKKYRGGGASRD